MIRDEMKNRISRVLVNSVLKQGFKARTRVMKKIRVNG